MKSNPHYIKLKQKAIEAGYSSDIARDIPLDNIQILSEAPRATETFLKNMKKQLIKEFQNRTNRSAGQWVISRMRNNFAGVDNEILVKYLRAAARILENE